MFMRRNHHQAVTESFYLDDFDEIVDASRQAFWDFQNRVNHSNATLLFYKKACKILELDELHLSVSYRKGSERVKWDLLSYQIQFIVWLYIVCDFDLDNGLCADEMSLGKTITALNYLQFPHKNLVEVYTPPEPTSFADNMPQIDSSATDKAATVENAAVEKNATADENVTSDDDAESDNES